MVQSSVGGRRTRLVLAIAVAVATTASRRWDSALATPDSSALADVIEAAATAASRPTLGRMSGGFTHRPYRPDDSRGLVPVGELPLLRAAARSEQRAAQLRGSAALRIVGVSRLISGQPDEGVQALEEAALRDPSSAGIQTDLAAAYLQRGQLDGHADDAVRALAAAERALVLEPGSPEARFNRALALEALELDAARSAWSDYASRDDSEWGAEAMARLEAWTPHPRTQPCSRPDLSGIGGRQQARECLEREMLPGWASAWLVGNGAAAAGALRRATALAEALQRAGGDAMPRDGIDAIARTRDVRSLRALAESHLKLAEAQALLADVRLEEAAEGMTEARAGFEGARSPYALWARVYAAIAARLSGRARDALADLEARVLSSAPQSYGHLHGRILWTRALAHEDMGRLDVARDLLQDAAAAFDACGEAASEAAVESMLAEALASLGDHAAAWQHERRALGWARRSPPTARSDIVYLNGALLALDEGMPEAALHFQEAVVAADVGRGDVARLPEAYLQRADTLAALGRDAEAEADARRAEQACARVPDPGIRARLLAEVHATRAALLRLGPERAEAAATAALAYFRPARHSLRVVGLLIARARAFAAAGDIDRAQADLAQAIRDFEAQRHLLQSFDDQSASFEDGRAAFLEMVKLQAVARGRADAALEYAQRGRTWFLTGSGTLAPPPGTLVLAYSALPDRVLAWAIDSAQRRAFQITLTPRALEVLVSDLRRAIEERRPQPDLVRSAGPLYDALLRPAADRVAAARRIVFVPDGPLHRLPFAALLLPDGRFLVEEALVEVSAGLSGEDSPGHRPARSVLAVGDGHTPTPSAPRLPGADEEARAVAALYPSADVLTGRDATPAAFLKLAPGRDVVHFAGHSVPNLRRPAYARLLMAPLAGNELGELYARDIALHSFRGTRVVVLASCSSAVGRVPPGEGPLNLARPFLAGGASSVVASLWPVDDRYAVSFFRAFHQALSGGADVAVALRNAQVASIRAAGAAGVEPINWAAFEVFRGSKTD